MHRATRPLGLLPWRTCLTRLTPPLPLRTLSTAVVHYSSLRSIRSSGLRSRIPRYHGAGVKQTIAKEEQIKPIESPLVAVPAPVPEESDIPSPASVPVHVPTPEHSVVDPASQGALVLTQPALVVGRELEMLNVFLGYEQANKYKIMDSHGNIVGYIAEEDGLGKSLSRQLLRTHRRLNATVMTAEGDVLFKIVRPFSWVNSRIFISTAEDVEIGEVQQQWHLLRRKYDLFTGTQQFATIDTPFLGWDFKLQDQEGGVLGNVDRNFVGFAREIFTDSGQYVLRMDAAQGNARGMTLDERAVTLACAISIDFDYFSRHSSHGGGGFLPFPMFGMGGGENRQDTQDPSSPAATAGPTDTGASTIGMGGINPPSANTPPPQSGSTTNEYGDTWLSDEQAGLHSPEDFIGGFFNGLKDFFDDE